MKIIEKVKHIFNETFCDEIIEIKPPREYWCDYHDIGRRLEGYKIAVKYKYKGWCEFLSGIDSDHFGILPKDKALKNAMNFYEKILFQINRHKTY